MRSQTRGMGLLLAGFGWFAARDVVAALVMWSCARDAGGSPEPEHRSRHKISGAHFRLGAILRARSQMPPGAGLVRRARAIQIAASDFRYYGSYAPNAPRELGQ